MKTRIVIFSLLMFCGSLANAQDFLFKVMASNGSNKVAGADAKSGQKIYKNQEVVVASGGYVSLVHNTGQTVELKTPGKYDASDLASKYVKKSSGFASRYSNFVLAGMDSDGGTGSANVTGAVHRGNAEGKNIVLFTSSSNDTDKNYMIKSEAAMVKWEAVDNGISDSYIVSLSDLEANVVFKAEVDGNSTVLDLSDVELKDSYYLLTVKGKGNDEAESKEAFIEVLSDEELKKREGDISTLKSELDLTAAIDNLVLASYYEEKKMYLNAVQCYEKAIELAPVDSYKMAYTNFLIRIGVKTAE